MYKYIYYIKILRLICVFMCYSTQEKNTSVNTCILCVNFTIVKKHTVI